jgi:hypothetical protein
MNTSTAFSDLGNFRDTELQPDIVLPVQFFARQKIDAPIEGEKRLMLAVLEDAVNSYQRYADATRVRGRRLFWETCEWFYDDDVEWPFSFLRICELLGIDASYFRRGLVRWLEVQRAGADGTKVVRFPMRRVAAARRVLAPPRERRRRVAAR